MHENKTCDKQTVNVAQAASCPAGCCEGTEILCLSIPCPITVVLLGLTLTVNLPCLKIDSATPLTAAQVQQLLGVLTGLLGGLIPTAG